MIATALLLLGASPLFVFGASPLFGLEVEDTLPPEPVSYEREIAPLLRQHCLGCHQPARAKGKLDLTTHAALLRGGRGGPAVVPGAPAESLLFELISSIDGEPPEMPVDAAPLDESQRDLVRRWIAEGAGNDSSAERASPTAENPPTYPRAPVLTSLDFSPDGELLAISGYHEVLVWRHDGSELVARLVGLSERIESVVFSPDGEFLAVAGGTPGSSGELQIWRRSSWKLSRSIPVGFDTIYGASWSPDGERVAVGAADHSLRAFDTETGEQVLFQLAHNDWVLGTAFSTDGTHLASVGRDRSLKLTKVETQQFIDNITSITPGVLKGGLMSVERHPERDELLVGGADGTPKVYRMYREKKRVIGDDFNLIRAFDPMDGRLFDVAWTPDGAHIAAVSSERRDGRSLGELRLFDVEDGKSLWTHVSPASLYAMDVHPSGSVIAVSGGAGVIELVDAKSGELIKQFSPLPPETDS